MASTDHTAKIYDHDLIRGLVAGLGTLVVDADIPGYLRGSQGEIGAFAGGAELSFFADIPGIPGATWDGMPTERASPPGAPNFLFFAGGVVDSLAPDFAGSLVVVAVTSQTITLSWPEASDSGSVTAEIRYEVHRALSPSAPFSVYRVVQGALSGVLDGLSPGTRYYLRVRARDAAGNTSAALDEVSVLTTGGAPVVTNFTPPAGTQISAFDPIAFDLTDDGPLRLALVCLNFAGVAELAHDGDTFFGLYRSSSRVAIDGGHRYIIRRAGGWPSPPEVRVYAVDLDGQEV